MHVDVDFLRRLRRQRRLSLAEAARLLGKSRSTIWRYENDKVNMSAAMLLQLAELYGVSVDQLDDKQATFLIPLAYLLAQGRGVFLRRFFLRNPKTPSLCVCTLFALHEKSSAALEATNHVQTIRHKTKSVETMVSAKSGNRLQKPQTRQRESVSCGRLCRCQVLWQIGVLACLRGRRRVFACRNVI